MAHPLISPAAISPLLLTIERDMLGMRTTPAPLNITLQ